MAGNHDKPRRVRKFIRKLKATSLMRAQGVQVVAHPEIRERNLDEFPGGVFSSQHWTAKECSTAQEVMSVLDSFNLVGRRIWSLHTSSCKTYVRTPIFPSEQKSKGAWRLISRL